MERVILVTSAYHMPRAKMLFDRAGVKSIPYPTDFKSTGGHLDWMSFVPSAGGLSKTSEWYSGTHRSVLLPDQVLFQRLIK